MLSEISSKKLRQAIGMSGLISLIMGALILLWPGRTASIASLLVGIAFILTGASTIWHALKMTEDNFYWRIGQLLLGGLNLIVGLFMFINMAVLFTLVGVFTGVAWIIDGVIAFAQIKYSNSKAWSILLGSMSIFAGFTLCATPLWGAAILWTVLGWVLLILGVVRVVRYFKWES